MEIINPKVIYYILYHLNRIPDCLTKTIFKSDLINN